MNMLHTVVARIIFAIPFAVFGISHFLMVDQLGGIVPEWLPGEGAIWAYITGAALIAAAVALIANRYARLACYGIVVFLLVLIAIVHIPGLSGDHVDMAITSILKDTGLIGGALAIAGISRSR